MLKQFVRNGSEHGKLTKQLRSLGAVSFDLWLPESHILPSILHKKEEVVGIVYGHYTQSNNSQKGRGVLVATNQRIILVDKKPLFSRSDELIYGVVSAVTYTKAGLGGTVTLHTIMGEINVRTFNEKCARTFVKAIEGNVFNNKNVTQWWLYGRQSEAKDV